MSADKLADAPITHDEAAEAVDAMDDCAKMDVSVDPFGPRATLERYIAQQRAASLAAPPAPGEAELPPLAAIDEVIRFLEAGMPTPLGGFNVNPGRFLGMLHDFKKARAAIAALRQPNGDVVVTRDERGNIVAVTRQDSEGRIMSVIAQNPPRPIHSDDVRQLPAKWRELAKAQSIIAEDEGLTEAEHDWHTARAQQAEECADALESALNQAPQQASGQAVAEIPGWRRYELLDIAKCLCSPSRFGATHDELREAMKSFGQQIRVILKAEQPTAPAPPGRNWTAITGLTARRMTVPLPSATPPTGPASSSIRANRTTARTWRCTSSTCSMPRPPRLRRWASCRNASMI